jgi:hypothetical protein
MPFASAPSLFQGSVTQSWGFRASSICRNLDQVLFRANMGGLARLSPESSCAGRTNGFHGVCGKAKEKERNRVEVFVMRILNSSV